MKIHVNDIYFPENEITLYKFKDHNGLDFYVDIKKIDGFSTVEASGVKYLAMLVGSNTFWLHKESYGNSLYSFTEYVNKQKYFLKIHLYEGFDK